MLGKAKCPRSRGASRSLAAGSAFPFLRSGLRLHVVMLRRTPHQVTQGAPRRAALSLAQRGFPPTPLTVPELKGVVRVFWLLLRELNFLEKSEVDGDLRSDSN